MEDGDEHIPLRMEGCDVLGKGKFLKRGLLLDELKVITVNSQFPSPGELTEAKGKLDECQAPPAAVGFRMVRMRAEAKDGARA
jgi:hypothetical protein